MNNKKEILAQSNVIKLEKNKEYLIIFNRDSVERFEDMQYLVEQLGKHGINGIAIAVNDVNEFKVIEKSVHEST